MFPGQGSWCHFYSFLRHLDGILIEGQQEKAHCHERPRTFLSVQWSGKESTGFSLSKILNLFVNYDYSLTRNLHIDRYVWNTEVTFFVYIHVYILHFLLIPISYELIFQLRLALILVEKTCMLLCSFAIFFNYWHQTEFLNSWRVKKK